METMVSESQKSVGIALVAEQGRDIAVLSGFGIRQKLRTDPSVKKVVIVIYWRSRLTALKQTSL
jgi:hypothetical protein